MIARTAELDTLFDRHFGARSGFRPPRCDHRRRRYVGKGRGREGCDGDGRADSGDGPVDRPVGGTDLDDVRVTYVVDSAIALDPARFFPKLPTEYRAAR
jgi:hypothetical protein